MIGDERAELERQRAEQAEQERVAEAQARRNAIPRMLGMGVRVEQVREELEYSVDEVRRFSQV